jgi:hypothetical protein
MSADLLRINQGKPPRISIAAIEKGNPSIGKCVEQHYFNKSLQTISPKPITLPEYFYYEMNCPLSFFISPEFIETLMKRRVYVLSRNVRIDVDCVFAVIPSGKLILNLNQEMYQRLGLTGPKSRLDSQRRIITIDLKDLAKESTLYDRVSWCFSNTCTDIFSFFMSTWNSNLNASQEFVMPETISHTKIHVQCKTKILRDCLTPSITKLYSTEEDRQDLMDVLEWIGMACIHSPRYFYDN